MTLEKEELKINSNDDPFNKDTGNKGAFNEWGFIEEIAIRSVEDAFDSRHRIERDWRSLRFHEEPDFKMAKIEYREFSALVVARSVQGAKDAKVIMLPGDKSLTLDSIYPRDAMIVAPEGLILCRMGRVSRRNEPGINAAALIAHGHTVLGEIQSPGTLEGGDFIWLDDHHAAVGLGPRTNEAGIAQLRTLLGDDVDLHVVPLAAPRHPEDVLHLMSMISPLDKDLALIYRPLMPLAFLSWLSSLGIEFVELSEEEFIPMGCNVLATGPRQVVMLDGLPDTKNRLEKAGCQVVTYKGEEISRKGEGGPTCLTRPLLRSRSVE